MEKRRHDVLTTIALSFVLLACDGEPTDPNGDLRFSGFPPHWGGFNGFDSFVLGVDRTNRHSGKAAAFLSAAETNPTTFGVLTQSVRADRYRGQRVRLSGWVRHADIDFGYGGLWLRVDGPRASTALDNMSNRPLVGESDWREVSIVLDVSSDAVGLVFGALLDGTGDLLVDDLRLQVVGATIPTTTNLITQPTPYDSASTATFYSSRSDLPMNLDFEVLTALQGARMAVPASGRPFHSSN